LNGISYVPNFIKIYQAVQKLIAGTHRQTGDLISLLLFLESRLKHVANISGLGFGKVLLNILRKK
jgi:hypothetical protein